MLDSQRQFRLFDLVMALSTATDMISPAVANHGKRVAYIAFSLAQEAGLSPAEQHELVLAGVLHDIGALGLRERLDLLEFESVNPGNHAELGYLFLSHSKLLANAALLVRYHHANWDAGSGAVVGGVEVPLGGHLLHLADRIDTAVFKQVHPLGQVDAITARIKARSGSAFMPKLVEAFERIAPREFFWLDIVSPAPDRVLQKVMQSAQPDLDLDALLEVAILISRIIDFKSSYTSTHSAGVAATAEALARLAGFPERECLMMLIAGHLHDLGKLSVPTAILDKDSALSKDEYGFIRSHSYYTRRILDCIPGLETITDWAASHHERISGEGYPYHMSGAELSRGARIVAVADVFTALTETRPYREGMARAEVLAILGRMASEDRLDQTLVDLLATHYDAADAIRLAAQAQAEADYNATLRALRA
jgi:HD-GYP domain-containing protein (c-di-GMP phosphodiesterase class II)